MRKKILLGVTVLALAAFPVLAQAQGGPGRGQAGPGPQMDQATAKAVQEAREKFRAETLELRRSVSLIRAEMRVLSLQPKVSQDELLAKYRELCQASNKLDDMRLIHRYEMARQYPQLAGPGSFGKGSGRAGRDRMGPGRGGQDRMGSARQGAGSGRDKGPGRGDESGPNQEMRADIQAAGEKLRAETADLRSGLRLKRAELKVLLLAPGTTQEALLAKNQEIHGITDQLGEKRLLNRLELAGKYPELALSPRPGKGPGKRF